MSTDLYSMRDSFIERIWQAMSDDESIFFISADFGSPKLDNIRRDFPDRFINVGIAEQNLINVSAGLALEGYTVFAYAIAPFITMRCFEQIRVNLALLSKVRKMNVNLIGVGAGYSYVVSGPTHQCYEDITIMRALPGIDILSPADHSSARAMFDACAQSPGLRYLRFDAQPLRALYDDEKPDINLGFHVHKRAPRVCFVATGYMVHTALVVSERLADEGLDTGVIDLFNLTGFDRERFQQELSDCDVVVSLEEGFKDCGGLDAMLLGFFEQQDMKARLINLGLEKKYQFELGSRQELHEQMGIGPDAVMNRVREIFAGMKPK